MRMKMEQMDKACLNLSQRDIVLLCIDVTKSLQKEWQTVYTQIRLLLPEQSDLGLDCLRVPVSPNT